MRHQCDICGSRTGLHGFSFDKQAQAMNAEKATEKKYAGVLSIPAELIPEWQDEALFMEQFYSALETAMEKRSDIPEIRIVRNDGRS